MANNEEYYLTQRLAVEDRLRGILEQMSALKVQAENLINGNVVDPAPVAAPEEDPDPEDWEKAVDDFVGPKIDPPIKTGP